MFKRPETKDRILGFTNMIAPKEKDENLPIEGQDFADPKEELNKIPSSHGEVANQKPGVRCPGNVPDTGEYADDRL